MTDKIPSQSACWTSLDQCLHDHHAVIAGDLRLQAAHAAFQLQLATLRAIHPGTPTRRPNSENNSLRGDLEFLLREVTTNILAPASAEVPGTAGIASAQSGIDPLNLLQFAEDTVRHLRDNPSLWIRFGLAALQVRSLADLHDAYALETGVLAPSGDLDERVKVVTGEIARLIGQELDPLVRAHSVSSPRFVADYQHARESRTNDEVESGPSLRQRLASRFRKKAELSLSN